MTNALSKITSALLAVLLLYLFPAVQTAQREEDIRYLAAYHALTEFADAVRTKGYISPVMYEEFTRNLEAEGNHYDIELEHWHKKYHPEYGDPADPNTFQGRFTVVYDAYYTEEILGVLFSENQAATSEEQVKYKLQAGDFFSVTAKDRSRSPYDVLSEFLYGTKAAAVYKNVLTYGGMVLNEDY
ncbi:hypothetical protein EHV15_25585 [Paenibacillus oralis]|uniref:Uncharacterized protein n=1 Tax=Paenibacillus oralis TaxID=2490856 RepID=A0A3P3U8J4_9BACL|nr:hypothetical protein [Paenibacillus oralis]RRJ65918.1 hypothetical protein EHV15_25585 [Paenibacillus oralis]